MRKTDLILVGLCVLGLACLILWYFSKKVEEEAEAVEEEPKDVYTSLSGEEVKRRVVSGTRVSLTEPTISLLMSPYLGRLLPHIPPKTVPTISTEPTEITFYSASRFTTSPRVRTVRIAPEVLRRVSEARFVTRL